MGELLSQVVPSPSCPVAFQPQHDADPSERTAQELKCPAETATALVMPDTGVAVGEHPVS